MKQEKKEVKTKINLFELSNNDLKEVKGGDGFPIPSACFAPSPDPRF